MLVFSNIFKTTSIRFQKEKLTSGECKDELMVAIDGNASADKTNLLKGFIEDSIRYDSLKSCDHLLVFDPSTWPQGMQDLHGFGNTTVCSVLKK